MLLPLKQLPARSDYTENVYRVLLDAICTGALAPGTRITQEEIAEQLAVSRSPVLLALRLLKKDGFVQDAPGRGVLVAPLDAAWTGRLYEVRGALDALAARLAAERGCVIPGELIQQGRKVSHGQDVNAMIDADLAFHESIYQASGNELIAETARLHWAHLRRVMGAVLQESKQRTSIWEEHQAIADAIAAGDGKRAAELTELHTRNARQNVVQQLDQVLNRKS